MQQAPRNIGQPGNQAVQQPGGDGGAEQDLPHQDKQRQRRQGPGIEAVPGRIGDQAADLVPDGNNRRQIGLVQQKSGNADGIQGKTDPESCQQVDQQGTEQDQAQG